MALNTGFRSSSNMAFAAGGMNIIVEILQMIWPEFMIPPDLRTYGTLFIAWVASRFTKTPAEPGIV